MHELLNHKIVGSGRPMVILHGMLGMLDNWSSFARTLEHDFQVILVDQRNHGRSFHDHNMRYQDLANDLVPLFEELGLESAIVMGHSMGGKTAMQFALSFPERVSDLIVLDIAPRKYHGNHNYIFAALQSLDLSLYSTRRDVRQKVLEQIDPGTTDFLLKNLARQPDGSYSWRLGLDEIYQAYDQLRDAPVTTKPYEGHTLFVKGERSPYIKEGDLEVIRQFFPQARLEQLADAGHWLHADQPQPLLRSVLNFLAQK